MATTVLKRCGGFPKVRKIVVAFQDKVMGSARLQHHFAGSDMRTLIDHQTKFVAWVMGGPASYSDELLRRVHQRLSITHEDFAELTALLRETLEEFDLEPRDVHQVCQEFRRRESCIVTLASFRAAS